MSDAHAQLSVRGARQALHWIEQLGPFRKYEHHLKLARNQAKKATTHPRGSAKDELTAVDPPLGAWTNAGSYVVQSPQKLLQIESTTLEVAPELRVHGPFVWPGGRPRSNAPASANPFGPGLDCLSTREAASFAEHGMRRPDVFGKYQLLTRIASGGMAEVWLARSSSIGGFEKLLAIKRIRSSLCDDEAFVSMFIAEAKLTVRLSHPNIVQVFDFGKVDEDYFMAMEYVEGADLYQIAQQARKLGTPLPVGASVYVLHQVMEGLAYAHGLPKSSSGAAARGLVGPIIHRDISPQNVLLSYDGHVKINDFGIAKAVHEAEAESDQVFGKVAYVSPEQCRGAPADESTDLWSAGVVLHELLTNQRLFARDSDEETMTAVEEEPVEKPSLLNPQVPRELDDFVLGCLERNPKQRLRSAREAAIQLALIQSRYFPTQTGFFLQETIRGLWNGTPPRVVPDADSDLIAQTRASQRRSGAADSAFAPSPAVGDETAAALAEAAARRHRHVRSDSDWIAPAEATRPARPARQEVPLSERPTEVDMEALPVSITHDLAVGPNAGIDRLKRLFIEDPNLWVLVDIGRAYANKGMPAAALGAYKLAAAKFAQGGLLVQAACIYRQILDDFGRSHLIRDEIRRLPGLQGRPNADLLADIFDPRDDTSDFSEYYTIFSQDDDAIDVFHESPILASLNAEQLLSFLEAVSVRSYPAASAIIDEGATDDTFYLLGRGRVVVSTKNFEGRKVYITSLSDGDCFGEQSYFTGEPRNATIETLGEATVLEVSKVVLSRVSQEFPTVRETLRRFYKERIAESLLAKSPLFGHLHIKSRRELAERFIFETFDDGDLVIRQGDHSDGFYAIKSGAVVVYTGGDDNRTVLAELGRGEIFGEIAAVEGSRRTASVRAVGACELLRLEAAELNAMLSRNVDLRRRIERTIAERTALRHDVSRNDR